MGAPRRKQIGLVGAAATLFTVLAACGPAPVPQDTWVVTPVRYDNSIDGQPENWIDITYPMPFITSDTAGGFWTYSASSWLHIGSDGNTSARFNDDEQMTVHGLIAETPTELIVARSDGGKPPGLYRFEPSADTWSLIADNPDPHVYPHQLSIDSVGAIHWSNGTSSYQIEPDGTVARHGDSTRSTVLAVSQSGHTVAYATPGASSARWIVNGGSDRARELLADTARCAGQGASPELEVTVHGTTARLPFTCAAHGVTWIDDRTFVASTGTENGAVIVKVAVPEVP